MNQNYALIIGVRDYRTYDPTGNADVPGAENDARAWVRSCLAIGFSPQNIRVLTSPELSVADLGPGTKGVQLGAADRASIIDGLTWISQQISGDAPATGLVTFSGHGEEGDDGCPLVCPSDFNGDPESAIDVAALRAKASSKVKDNLTLMLDCCHAQVKVGTSATIRDRLRTVKRAVTGSRGRLRVVAACMRDQESVSSSFIGETMGAFTWAVTSTLGQWKPAVENGVAYLGVSYGNLVTRVRVVLGALSFEQVPVVSGPEGVRGQEFLQPGKVESQEGTALQPTAERKGRQLDFGNYDMMDGSLRIAYVVVDSENETWHFYGSGLQQMAEGRVHSFFMKRTSATPNTGLVPSGFTSTRSTPTKPDWESASGENYEWPYNYRWSAPNPTWETSGTSYFTLSFHLTDSDPQDVDRIDFFSGAETQFSPPVNVPYDFEQQGGVGSRADASYVVHTAPGLL